MHGVNAIRRKVWYLVKLFGKKSTKNIQDNDKIKETF